MEPIDFHAHTQDELIELLLGIQKDNEQLAEKLSKSKLPTDIDLEQNSLNHNMIQVLLNYVPDFIFFKDLNSKFIFINNAYAKFLNIEDPVEAKGKTIGDFFSEEVNQKVISEEKEVIQQRKAIAFEQLISRSEEEQVWLLTTKGPIFNTEGDITGIFGISKNITELKKVGEDLAESEGRLERAEKVAKIGNWKLLLNSMKMNSSKGARIVYGVDKEALSLSDVQKIPLPKFREEMNQALTDLIQKNKPYYQEFIISRPNDGNQAYIKSIAEYDSRNNIIFGVIQDITESKQTELLLKEQYDTIEAQNEEYQQINEELRETNIELFNAKVLAEENEHKFRTITTQATEGIVLSDTKGNYVFVNPAFCKMTGYSEEELLNLSVTDLISKNHVPVFFENKETLEGSPMLVHLLRKNGTEFYGEIMARSIHLYNSELILGTVRDITDRENAQQEMRMAKEKAEESDRLKTAFLQNISHEIRTPMNAIMGFTGLLVENYNNKNKLEEFSAIIRQRCSDLLGIINDILDIAKIESGQLPVYQEPCDMEMLFADLSAIFIDYQSNTKKEHISFSLQSFLLHEEKNVLTDKLKLKQIFINLITNAFKFTEHGSINVTASRDNSENLIFKIEDTGIGIPMDKQEIIFNRFTQLHQVANQMHNGTGLGLTIVKGLVELLKGKIWIQSELDVGSVFSFTIPYHPVIQEKHEIIFPLKESIVDFSEKTVLIVEDDFYNAKYLKEVLIPTGIAILETSFGKDAIQIADEKKPDIILMDIRLPDMDGYTTTKIIKQKRPEQRIIAQTAFAAQDERHNAMEAGCDDYLKKPIEKTLLIKAMSFHLYGK